MTFPTTIFVEQEEKWFIAKCLENNIASQGKNLKEALERLCEALDLFSENQNALFSNEELDAMFVPSIDTLSWKFNRDEANER